MAQIVTRNNIQYLIPSASDLTDGVEGTVWLKATVVNGRCENGDFEEVIPITVIAEGALPRLSTPVITASNGTSTTAPTVILEWTPIANATHYTVMYTMVLDGVSTTVENVIGTVSGANHRYTTPALNTGRDYSFQIRAHGNPATHIQSSWSNIVTIRTLGTPTTVPLATPTMSLSSTTSSITVSWIPQHDILANVSNYEIEYIMTTSSPNWNNVPSEQRLTAPSSNTSRNILGLQAGNYHVRMRAIAVTGGLYGNSPWAEGSIIIEQVPTLSAPTNVTAVQEGNQIRINWTAVPGATNGYRIEWASNNTFTSTDRNNMHAAGQSTTSAITNQPSSGFGGLAPGTSWYVRMKAEGTVTHQESSWTNANNLQPVTIRQILETPVVINVQGSLNMIQGYITSFDSAANRLRIEWSSSSAFTSINSETIYVTLVPSTIITKQHPASLVGAVWVRFIAVDQNGVYIDSNPTAPVSVTAG